MDFFHSLPRRALSRKPEPGATGAGSFTSALRIVVF